MQSVGSVNQLSLFGASGTEVNKIGWDLSGPGV